MRGKYLFLLATGAVALIVLAIAVSFSNNRPAAHLLQSQELPSVDNQTDSRLARLRGMELPPDGLDLYQTLLTEIPEVVSQVPCACCNKMLATCYRGFCPPT